MFKLDLGLRRGQADFEGYRKGPVRLEFALGVVLKRGATVFGSRREVSGIKVSIFLRLSTSSGIRAPIPTSRASTGDKETLWLRSMRRTKP